MTAKLYTTNPSAPSLTARAMLEHKGIEYRVVEFPPGMQRLVRLRGFPGGTVPALKYEGRRVQRTRNISRFLDEVRPDPPLFPADPEARRRVEEAEEWGDEVLQQTQRRIFLWGTANEPALRRWLAVDVRPMPGGRLLARPAGQAKAFARGVGADDETVRRDVAALPELLAEVERLRAEGVIGGEQPNAADFQIAGSLRGLPLLTELHPYLADHPAISWAATLVAEPPGPAPPFLPQEWLGPLESLR